MAVLVVMITGCVSETTSTTAPSPVVVSTPALGPDTGVPEPQGRAVRWATDDGPAESEIRVLLGEAGLGGVLVPVGPVRGAGEFVSVEVSIFGHGIASRTNVQTHVRDTDGNLLLTVTLLPQGACAGTETRSVDVRGAGGCLVEDGPLVMVEWQESQFAFRASSRMSFEDLIRSLDSFLLVAA